MSIERVTVSLPADVRQAAQEIAESSGISFSAVVNQAVQAWLRGQLIDAWLLEYQEEHGVFDEDELRALAEETGVPYLPPQSQSSAA